MADRSTKEKRAELRKRCARATRQRFSVNIEPEDLLSLLDEVEALDAELAGAWVGGHESAHEGALLDDNPYRKPSE